MTLKAVTAQLSVQVLCIKHANAHRTQMLCHGHELPAEVLVANIDIVQTQAHQAAHVILI
jgi:hypothetical protein